MVRAKLGRAVAMVLFASIVEARADWVRHAQDNPFEGGGQEVAMAPGDRGWIGFRCQKKGDVAAVLLTPLAARDDLVRNARRMSVALWVVIDDMPRREFVADLIPTPDGKTLRFVTADADVVSLLDPASAAKRRVAFAGVVNGGIVHTSSASARGTRAALRPLIARCGGD
jgi:hypothetical protein